MAQLSDRVNIRELSIAERILLAQDIWDSIVAEEESLTLTEFERQELDSRMETYDVALEKRNHVGCRQEESSLWTVSQSILFLRTAEYRIPE